MREYKELMAHSSRATFMERFQYLSNLGSFVGEIIDLLVWCAKLKVVNINKDSWEWWRNTLWMTNILYNLAEQVLLFRQTLQVYLQMVYFFFFSLFLYFLFVFSRTTCTVTSFTLGFLSFSSFSFFLNIANEIQRPSPSLSLPLLFSFPPFLLLTLPRRNPRLTQSKEKRLSSCRPSSAPSSSPSSATSPTSSCAPPCSEITTTRGTWGYSEWFPEGLASSLPGRSYKKRKKRGRA